MFGNDLLFVVSRDKTSEFEVEFAFEFEFEVE